MFFDTSRNFQRILPVIFHIQNLLFFIELERERTQFLIFFQNRLAFSGEWCILLESSRDIAQPGLARLSGGQKVASSNLAIPTICSIYGILDTTFESC